MLVQEKTRNFVASYNIFNIKEDYMKHSNYTYEVEEEVSFAANEATINMDFYRTKSFLDRHSRIKCDLDLIKDEIKNI